MYLTREDRWRPVIDKLKAGVRPEIEVKRKNRKTKSVFIEGHEITPKIAYLLSGIRPQFFDKYIGQEVPIEDIMDALDRMWIRKKTRQLKAENLLK